jgi:hypothetical protein
MVALAIFAQTIFAENGHSQPQARRAVGGHG